MRKVFKCLTCGKELKRWGAKHCQKHSITPERIERFRIMRLGQPSWNKNKKLGPHTEEHNRKIGNALLGGKMPESQRTKLSEARKGKGNPMYGKPAWNKGLKKKDDVRISTFWKGKKRPEVSGSNNWRWKGGITPEIRKIRNSMEYKLWREAVFIRDNYTCIWCGTRSGNGKKVIIHADHIKPFALYPELRFAVDNGRTLCKSCHLKTDTHGYNTIRKKITAKN